MQAVYVYGRVDGKGRKQLLSASAVHERERQVGNLSHYSTRSASMKKVNEKDRRKSRHRFTATRKGLIRQ